MNRPTELTVAYAKYIWNEDALGLEELVDLKQTVFNWVDSVADETEDGSAIFLKGVGGYALASVDWRVVEAEVEKMVNERSSET